MESNSNSSQSRSGRLEGKTAIVTGAARYSAGSKSRKIGCSGIGFETAVLFVAEGAQVALADIDGSAGQAALARLEAQYPQHQKSHRAIFLQCDVSSDESVASMIQQAERHFGRINVLFNNAGIMHTGDGDSQATSDKIWDLTMNVNAKSVFYCCRHGIPALRRAGGGSVINTASFVAKMGAATPQIACAVLAMSRELAVIHARENIRVNALCPGPLRTPLLMSYLDTEEKQQRRLVHVPMGRFGEASEIAKAVVFLASDESSFVTGTDFMVDGGISAAYVTPE